MFSTLLRLNPWSSPSSSPSPPAAEINEEDPAPTLISFGEENGWSVLYLPGESQPSLLEKNYQRIKINFAEITDLLKPLSELEKQHYYIDDADKLQVYRSYSLLFKKFTTHAESSKKDYHKIYLWLNDKVHYAVRGLLSSSIEALKSMTQHEPEVIDKLQDCQNELMKLQALTEKVKREGLKNLIDHYAPLFEENELAVVQKEVIGPIDEEIDQMDKLLGTTLRELNESAQLASKKVLLAQAALINERKLTSEELALLKKFTFKNSEPVNIKSFIDHLSSDSQQKLLLIFREALKKDSKGIKMGSELFGIAKMFPLPKGEKLVDALDSIDCNEGHLNESNQLLLDLLNKYLG